MNRLRAVSTALVTLVALLAVAQLVPYGRRHSNPPDGQRVAFDTSATQDLARRACYDCHSNRTRWPWYASIAPWSWRIQNHVDEGRRALNFTAFTPAIEDVAEAAGEAAKSVAEGEMPPRDYLLMHPEARLSTADRDALVHGLRSTFAAFAESEHASTGEVAETGGAKAGERHDDVEREKADEAADEL